MGTLVKNKSYRLEHVDRSSGFGILYSRLARHTLYLNPLMSLLWQCTAETLDASCAAQVISAETGFEVSADDLAQMIADLRRNGLLLEPAHGGGTNPPSALDAPLGGYSLDHVYFYATRECNARCYHCYLPTVRVRSTSRPPGPGQITGDEFLQLVEAARPLGLKGVKITGGEPFLRDDMVEIIRGLAALGLQVAIETNGTLIDEKAADVLVENHANVSLSLDGASAETHDAYRRLPGGFDKVIGSLRLLSAKGGNVKVIMSVSHRNYPEMEEVFDIVRANGCTCVKVNPVTTLGIASRLKGTDLLMGVEQIIDLFRRRQELEAKHGVIIIIEGPPAFLSVAEIAAGRVGVCPFTNILGVLADGSISYCGIGNTRKELIFGNALEDGFDIRRLWQENPQLRRVREELAGGIQGVCAHCVHEPYCKGACRAQAYDESESFRAPYGWCQTAYDKGIFPEEYLIDGEAANGRLPLRVCEEEGATVAS